MIFTWNRTNRNEPCHNSNFKINEFEISREKCESLVQLLQFKYEQKKPLIKSFVMESRC